MPGRTLSIYTAVAGHPVHTKRRSGTALPRSRSRLAPLLLETRPGGSFRWPEMLCLCLYCGVLFATIAHHESWFDEAQAWLIARDSSLSDLFLHRLHYEGAPGLWHLLLWCEARCGVSFAGMHYIAGAFASLGMAVWLRHNPLPRLLSLLMPFTYFFLFQYAVVARSYTLAPLFVFILLYLYGREESSPLVFAVIAGLFANCSLHMAAFAVGLTVFYMWDRLSFSLADRSPRRLFAPSLVFLAFLMGAAWTAVPTADGSSTSANPIVSSLRTMGPHAATAGSLRTAPIGSGPEEQAEAPSQGRIGTMLWTQLHVPAGAPPKQHLRAALLRHGVVLLTAITGPIATSNELAFLLLGMVLWNVARMRLWLALAPYALVQLCNVLIAGEAHHIGLAWLALVAALWILALETSRRPWETTRLQHFSLLLACVLLVELVQVGWSVHAVHADLKGSYSPGKDLAVFLRQQPAAARIATFDQGADVANAYVPGNLYFNTGSSYYPFSRSHDPDLRFAETMATHPDIVVVTLSVVDVPVMNQWVTLMPKGTVLVPTERLAGMARYGYRETRRFCGTRVYRDAAEAIDCDAIFIPNESPKP